MFHFGGLSIRIESRSDILAEGSIDRSVPREIYEANLTRIGRLLGSDEARSETAVLRMNTRLVRIFRSCDRCPCE